MLLREAAQVHNWDLDYGSIALMWRGGCIIRSVFLGQIKKAFDSDKNLRSLLLAPFFIEAIARAQTGWRNVVATAVRLGRFASVFQNSAFILKNLRCAYSCFGYCIGFL